MKKRILVFTILLFSLLILFSSCSSNARKLFDEGNYTKTLEALKEKKGLTKNDYLMKIKSYVNLGRKDDARESVLLYLLMTDESDDREFALDLYTGMDFSDVINVLVLKDTDGLKAQILKYQSYVNLKMYDEAKTLLADKLSSELTIEQFATLLVAYPVDADYVYSFFNAWFNTLTVSEKPTYYSLFFYFIRTNLPEAVSKKCFELINKFDSDVYFTESLINRALLYKSKGFICESLFDNYNAHNYFLESYNLNPKDEEVIDKLK